MVGGEFEIDLSIQREASQLFPGTYCYASGRAALYQILKSLKNRVRKIWFPDWLCHTMVEAAQKAGYEYDFYELSDQFKATVEALDTKGFMDGCVVVLINYFGLQDLTSTTKAIKEVYSNAIVIEDDVQAYFCFAEETNPYADYRFTSLRKTFPTPDGGLVYTNKTMPSVIQPNTFIRYKIEAGVMKSHRGENGVRDEDYLALFEKGSELINENYESVMSHDSEMLFAGTDLQQVKWQRKANVARLLDGLKLMGIQPLIEVPENKTPLFVPIYLENRNEVRKNMFAHEVFCPVHWPLEGLPLKKGAEMAQYELSLIVDQRYSVEDMNIILSLL